MLHPPGPLHDLHDGPANLHAKGSVLRSADGDGSVVPVCHAMCSPPGAVLLDALRAADGLPPGPRADLLPGPDLCRSRDGDALQLAS